MLVQIDHLAKEEYGASFRECEAGQKEEMIAGILEGKSTDAMDTDSGKNESQNFLTITKQYTIQGFLQSEFVMTEINPYQLGPDLSNAGQSKTRGQLVHSILRPSDEISPQWQGWYIKLKDGTIPRGRQINVGYDDIEIYTQAGEVVSFEKSEIEDYGITDTSLMPAGLEFRLTVSDMQDLVTFLESED